jgi:hypothetical protein
VKPGIDVNKFTNFGKWWDIAHVKEYIGYLIELTNNEYNQIYEQFCGQFSPIVSIVEEVLMDTTISDAVNRFWTILTCHETNSVASGNT